MAGELKSVYKRGAEDGLRFGIYLSVLYMVMIAGASYSLASLAAFVMIAAVPLIVYRFLRRGYVAEYETSTFSLMWLHGIVIFFCGSMLAGVVLLVYLRWINPDFVVNTLQRAIELYDSIYVPQAKETAKVLRQVIEQKLVPTPIEIVAQLIWLAVFSGSLLSMILALVVPLRSKKKQ